MPDEEARPSSSAGRAPHRVHLVGPVAKRRQAPESQRARTAEQLVGGHSSASGGVDSSAIPLIRRQTTPDPGIEVGPSSEPNELTALDEQSHSAAVARIGDAVDADDAARIGVAGEVDHRGRIALGRRESSGLRRIGGERRRMVIR